MAFIFDPLSHIGSSVYYGLIPIYDYFQNQSFADVHQNRCSEKCQENICAGVSFYKVAGLRPSGRNKDFSHCGLNEQA